MLVVTTIVVLPFRQQTTEYLITFTIFTLAFDF
jgi:hypothetical protein